MSGKVKGERKFTDNLKLWYCASNVRSSTLEPSAASLIACFNDDRRGAAFVLASVANTAGFGSDGRGLAIGSELGGGLVVETE
jgi:hypothetical protein